MELESPPPSARNRPRMSPDDEGAEVRGLDPWGLSDVEELLRGLEGVGSLKVVPDGHGGIDEVHVVSDQTTGPKQIVRNIESALLAEFGLQIDHRKISVAQIREPDIAADGIEAGGEAREEPGAGVAGARWLLLDSVEIDRRAGQKVRCRVSLESDGETHEGEAEGPDFSQSRLDVAAKAVLEALNEATLEDVELRLEDVKRLNTFEHDLVVALVQGQERRRNLTLPGVSIVSDSPEEAAVLACLQATNRWVGAV